ncbi:YihY/virulence factor BrkB family protein [Arsenicitalea aurantiaca]|uniref:YihY/virulence factor BrkB family protein n=1 Tax=Arsenicitalea aurantiaca TaxID=1783274 RepID=A0A433XLQ0_9HYPH|nr:YihY/virulence factor BrkB family protein [Arsenicitalea aurantiaca]RUT35016.1 YihY/virulence factor BrkB family protein [Arsenicitalea aurantiaca]
MTIEETTGATQASARGGFRKRWKSILLETGRSIVDMDTSLRCAGVAFFGFLSLFPGIATVVLIYGLAADRENLADHAGTFQFVLPDLALDIVTTQLDRLISQPPSALGLGLLISVTIALWSGSRGVNALIYAMSRVRGEPDRRNFLVALLVSVGLTISGAIFLIVALVTVAGLPAITRLLPFPTATELIVLAIRWPILLGLSIAVVAALYRWGPDRHPRKFRYIWPGAFIASILWMLAGVVFSLYVENFGNFEASFGAMTAAVVLLLWMYNSALIFVLGAALNTQLEFHDRPDRRGLLKKG